MNAETLNIKMKLDIGNILNDVKKIKTQLTGMAQSVKQSIPKIGTESKKAKEALGDVTKASKEATKAIDGIGSEAQESLSTVSKQSNKVAQALASIGIASKNAKAGLNMDDTTNSADGAASSFEEMQGTMQSILALDFATVLAKPFAGLVEKIQSSLDGLKEIFANLNNAKATKAALEIFDYSELGDQSEMLDDIKKKIKDLKKEVISSFSAMAKSVGAMISKFAALATVIGAVVLAINALKMSELGAEIYTGAQKAGMSAQKYQEWKYVLEQAGIEASELTEVIKTLTEAQIDVINQDEEFISAFAKLGMSAEDVMSMGQDALWENTIAALQNVENATERTAIAYKIFGEDAAKLTTILNLSNAETQKLISTYNSLGGAMSGELIHNSAVLQASLANLRVAWQGLRNTLAQWVIPAVIVVVNWLTKAIVAVNVFLQKFFNLDLTPATDSMTKGVTGTTGAVGDYTKAVNGATKAVENLKRTQMGFDELNVVTNPNVSDGSSGGSSGGVGGSGTGGSILGMDSSVFAEASKQVEEFEKKVSDFMDKWGWAIEGIALALGALTIRNLLIQLASAIGYGEKLAAILSFKGIASALSGVVGWLGTFFALLKEGNSLSSVLAASFPKVATALSSVSTAAGGALASIGSIFGLTGSAAIAAGAAVIVAVIAAVAGVVVYLKRNWDEVTAAVQRFFAEDIKPKLTSIKESLEELIPPVVLNALKKMWQGIKDIVAAIGDWFASVEWVKAIGDVFEVIGEIIFNVLAGTIAGAIESVIGWIDGLLKAISGVKTIISGVVGAIIAIFKGDLPKAKQEVTKIFDGIKQYLSGWYNMSLGVVVNFVKGVGDWFAKLYPKFEQIWTKIKKLFSNVGTAIADAVVGAVKGAINAVLRTVTNKINTFIGWINGAIGVINEIPGVNIGKITKLEVPQLATGGIVTSDTIARIGERGKKEAVLPLEQNTGWMDTLANKIAAKSGSDQPINVHLNVDGTELGWVVIKNINSITKQTGKVQLAW